MFPSIKHTITVGKRLSLALICLVLLFSSFNSIQAQTLEFDATKIERFGSIGVLAAQDVYTVSKTTHSEQERDAEGTHVLNAIELELQIQWKIRKVIENKESIQVYALKNDNTGEFVPTRTVEYGTHVNLTQYEYLEEDVLRYKGLPDPNFNLSEYIQYSKSKRLPAFRLRVQDKFMLFIKSNTELVNKIKELAKNYGYGKFEISSFSSVATKETNNLSKKEAETSNALKRIWVGAKTDPKEESKGSKRVAYTKFAIGVASYIGIYFYQYGEQAIENISNHPVEATTFTIILTSWIVGKELMYSWWMSWYQKLWDGTKMEIRDAKWFNKVFGSFDNKVQVTAAELIHSVPMALQTGIFMLIDVVCIGGMTGQGIPAAMDEAWSKIGWSKLLSMISVLSNAGTQNFVVKGRYGYNNRVTFARFIEFAAPARDALVIATRSIVPAVVYYVGIKGMVWLVSKVIDYYRDYTEFYLAYDKASRNKWVNATAKSITKLENASEFFYSRNKYGYVHGEYNEDKTLNRVVVAIDNLALNDEAASVRKDAFSLELPESIWKLLSQGKGYGEKVTLYTYNNDGSPVAIEYKVNSKFIKIPKGRVDSYLTLFTDVKDVINEGKSAYAQGLNAAIITAYGKLGDMSLSERKRDVAGALLFTVETNTLSKLLKVIDALSDIDLIILDAALRDIASAFPAYVGNITEPVATIELALANRNVSPSDLLNEKKEVLSDPKTETGEKINKVFNSYEEFENKVKEISISLPQLEDFKAECEKTNKQYMIEEGKKELLNFAKNSNVELQDNLKNEDIIKAAVDRLKVLENGGEFSFAELEMATKVMSSWSVMAFVSNVQVNRFTTVGLVKSDVVKYFDVEEVSRKVKELEEGNKMDTRGYEFLKAVLYEQRAKRTYEEKCSPRK